VTARAESGPKIDAVAARESAGPGRRVALRAAALTGATALGAVALGQRSALASPATPANEAASASGTSLVVTDPLTANTCVLPSGDTTGNTDTPNINNALAANLSGQNVVLAAGVFYVNSPIIIPPGGVLRGQFANENTELSVHAWGSCISAVGTWEPVSVPGGAVNAVVACIGQEAGGYSVSGDETKIYGVMIDCLQVPRTLVSPITNGQISVDGLQIFGKISRAHLERVLIAHPSGCGFNMVNDSFGLGPDAVHLERVNVRYPGDVGFKHIKISDSTYYDCLCENGAADGFYIQNGSNSVWTACRSEHNAGNGYTYMSSSTSTGSGVARLVGCSSDRNEAHGIYITSSDGLGLPVVLSACAFRRDGRQDQAGGGVFAGIAISSYPGPVQISGCTVWPGVDDDGTGTPSPNYGLILATNAPKSQVVVAASYIQGAGTFLNDDGTTPDVRWGPDVVGAHGPSSKPTLRAPRMGEGKLSGGTATISSNCVNANSIIQLTQGFVNGGTPGILRVSGRTAGTGFEVTSSSGTDQSSFYWQINNP